MSPQHADAAASSVADDGQLVAAVELALSGAIEDLEAATRGLDERSSRAVHRAAAIAREVRRQRSLTTSVSQFAGAITSVRGADSALQQLVARTRTLAGVDMAYVSINDDDDGTGRTRIVATDGVWTESYRTLRMPLGAGVLGRVASAGGPVQTADYQVDIALVHDAAVDRIVEAEGVRAILGAPVWIDGRVAGALMVANRYVHRFDEDELFIVATLANLAAVAIDNVRRLGDLGTEVAQERARAEALRSRLDVRERTNRVDDALLGALRTGGGVHELVARMTEMVGRAVRIVDLSVKYDLAEGEATLDGVERSLLAQSLQTGAPASSPGGDPDAGDADGDAGDPDAGAGEPPAASVTVMAVRRGRDAIGALVVDAALSAEDGEVLERCADVVAAYLVSRDRARGDLAERRRELVEQLIAPPVGGIAPANLTRLAEFGVKPEGPFRLLVAVGTAAALAAFDHRLELDYGRTLLRAEFDGDLVGVVPEAAFARLVEAVEAAGGAGSWRGLRISHSPALHAFEIIPAELDLVQKVLEASRISNGAPGAAGGAGGAAAGVAGGGVLVSLRSYGAIGSFLSKVHLEPTRRLIADLVGPLAAYDREQGTPLVETAYVYLDAAHSVSAAAARLHVHKNTVRQRLDRIATILGADWADGQRGLDHHIALSAHRILGD